MDRSRAENLFFRDMGQWCFDESHKLIDAARQMYSTVWDEQDAEFIVGLSEVNRRTTGMDDLLYCGVSLRNITDRYLTDWREI